MKFALRDIKPNPFRNTDHYPINRDKIEQLKASIQSTEFWDNIVARKNGKGAEIAYGHHRLVALRELFKPTHMIELIVRDLDNAQMLRIMANENMTEWQHDASIEHETVRAVVLAYGAGKIELENLHPKLNSTNYRNAPSFTIDPDRLHTCVSDRGQHLYTAATIAKFLGWESPSRLEKVHTALHALEQQEEGIIDAEDFVGLGPKQAREVSMQLNRVKALETHRGATKTKAMEVAKKVVKQLAEDFRQGTTSILKADTDVNKLIREVTGRKTELPDIQDATVKVSNRVGFMLETYGIKNQLDELVKYRERIPRPERVGLVKVLRLVAVDLEEYANRLEEEESIND